MIIQNKDEIFKAFDKLDKDLQNELTATVTKNPNPDIENLKHIKLSKNHYFM